MEINTSNSIQDKSTDENKLEELDKYEEIIEEFKELDKKLEEPLDFETIYHDKEKRKKKYTGEMKDGKFEGRGILYAFSGKVEYNGYFKENKYEGFGKEYNYYDNKLKYEGYFSNFKYNGKGILYYKNNNIFFCGVFKEGKLVKGILYDPDGNITYKGDIIDKNPKEGKNIKTYEISGDLIYEGDFLNGNYHGQGTLYETGKYEKKGIFSVYKRKKYIGQFINGKYEGIGKLYIDHIYGKYLFYQGKFNNNIFNEEGTLYYRNGQKYYEGTFKNGEICGKGIRYYKNGSKKFEGIFENNDSFEGRYFNPKNKEIYKGKILNEMPYESKSMKLFNNNMNKTYKGEIRNYSYEGQGVEYFPLIKDMVLYKGNFSKNYFIAPKMINENKENLINIAIYYEYNELDVKNLINRFMGIEINTSAEDVKKEYTYKFEYNKIHYIINFIQHKEINHLSNANIIFYIFDLNNDKQIKTYELEEIKKINIKTTLIYLIGNNLNIIESEDITKECLEEYRSLAIKLISEKSINKYFEISIQTGKGCDNLKKNMEIDSALYIKNRYEKYKSNISEHCSIF